MIEGHGDDAYKYEQIRINFSSNVYNHVEHEGLKRYLSQQMDSIRSYPEPRPYSLERLLAERELLSPEEVCVTNGATEAIYLIAQAYREATSAICMPTFSEYKDACLLHEHRVITFYQLDRQPLEARLVWICNPNNPTGTVWKKEELQQHIEKHPETLFILDQSYEAFTQQPLFSTCEAVELPNVLLLHSMTKRYAVPGLRLGYLTGNSNLLSTIRRQRMPWSVNQLAIEAGHYLIKHNKELAIDLSKLLQEKEWLRASLQSVGGMEVWQSDTHYMLVRLRIGKAAALKEYLATEHGILIRDASNFEGLDEHFFRIATQTREENEELVANIKQWIYTY